MLARDVMTTNVVTVRPNMTARAAAAVLVVHGFASAPVITAEGVLRGIVTEADLLRVQPLPDLTHVSTATDTTAGEAMMPNPMTMRPTDDLSDIVAVMLEDGLLYRCRSSRTDDWSASSAAATSCDVSRGANWCPATPTPNSSHHSYPPASKPFMDDHLVYAGVLVALALLGAGNTLGLGRIWTATPLVRRAPWLA